MGTEGAGSLESLAALFTLEHLLCGVHGPVLRKTDFVAECLVAQFTGEWSFAVVRSPRVHLREHIAYIVIDILQFFRMQQARGKTRKFWRRMTCTNLIGCGILYRYEENICGSINMNESMRFG